MGSLAGIRRLFKRMLTFLAVLFVGSYLALAVFAWFFAESMIFQPQRGVIARDENLVFIASPTGEMIAAKFFENPAAELTILFSHGNAEDIIGSTPFFEQLRDAGFNVLTYDYRGYGASDGRPSEKNAYEDIDAAYDYLVKTRNIDPSKIIIHGRSLGGAVSIDLASRRECAGLIAESTFTSAFRVLTTYRVLPFDRFDSLSKIGRVESPVLFIHGENDSLVKRWHSERLFAATNASKELMIVANAGHNDVTQKSGTAYFQRIRDFAANLPE